MRPTRSVKGPSPFFSKTTGRRQIKKTTEAAIKTEVIAYWSEKLEKYTFNEYFNRWLDVKAAYGISENTLYKYKCDYKRFFEKTDFGKKDIRNITSEDITIFMINTIKDKQLKQKAGVALWGYIYGTFKSAFINADSNIKDRLVKNLSILDKNGKNLGSENLLNIVFFSSLV